VLPETNRNRPIMGLFVLFWVNIVFLVAMVAFCYCGIKALGRKGRREEDVHEQSNENDDQPQQDGIGVESAPAGDPAGAGAPSAPGQAARYGFIWLMLIKISRVSATTCFIFIWSNRICSSHCPCSVYDAEAGATAGFSAAGAAFSFSSSKAERDAVEAWTARLVEALFGCTAVRTRGGCSSQRRRSTAPRTRPCTTQRRTLLNKS
jgi:hypothetical protein